MVLGLLVCFGFLSTAIGDEQSENWHQWRGPNADGVAPHGNPPIQWDEKTNVKWKIEIPGEGSASPIVWKDKIFLVTAIKTDKIGEQPSTAATQQEPAQTRQRPNREGSGDRPQVDRRERREGQRGGERGGRERSGRRRGRGMFRSEPPKNIYQFDVLCIDRNTGKEIWRKTAIEALPHEGHHQTNTYASGSPTTDGQYLYVTFGSRGIYCYDMDGELQWKRDLGKMRTVVSFGEGTSPTLHQDSLIVNWDHEDQSFLSSLDAKTGKTKWKTERDERTTWATPLVVEHNGKKQVVINGSKRVRSYDFETGKLLWECGGQARNPIPSPVRLDDLVYCMTGFRGYALYAIPLDSQGDITDTNKIAWKLNDGTPYIASPLLYGDLLYFTKSRDTQLSCVNAKTGEVYFDSVRLPDLLGTLYSSPVGASNRIYITNRDGKTLVIKRSKELEVLALNQLDEEIDASPAIVGNQIFLRGKSHLYCIEKG